MRISGLALSKAFWMEEETALLIKMEDQVSGANVACFAVGGLSKGIKGTGQARDKATLGKAFVLLMNRTLQHRLLDFLPLTGKKARALDESLDISRSS